MTRSEQQWFVVQTQPNAERRALTNLIRQRFEVYLPCYLKRRSHAGKADVVAAPLFPRYLFVSIDLATQQWRAINSTFGVSKLLCRGERPAALPKGIIAHLRSREDQRGLMRLDQCSFSPGKRVRVVDGAFYGQFGIFEMMSDRERVAVLLDLLGRTVRVEMSINLIEAA
ncbi:transcription termination/antitermination protein NusG [Bradyrhizobium centrosematis]|uniref:transcription termination/antitermination protein NusG n=1 Tax=Bradyrhizobium centrosematis TaxID=1300039 RepID=UPI0021681E79|nr:transcriptional activator RfaH [Bradyrhizobium centrosematis]MCS3765310.1 transcriptional antiterminator RfaH [Bradyrhizobium centrosematis]MCS3773990.1 transcriptional antiterminator RfaH [Bradyrhizobium centrosematis]